MRQLIVTIIGTFRRFKAARGRESVDTGGKKAFESAFLLLAWIVLE
jgi:hypothetical protein